MQSKHADLLNVLDAMQQSHYYALRKHELAKAEKLIVSQEQRITQLEAALDAATGVPAEVVEAAEHQKRWCEEWIRDVEAFKEVFGSDFTASKNNETALLIANFILSLAAKGKEGA